MSELLKEALDYAARGWQIFPCEWVTWQAEAGGVVPRCSCRRDSCKSPGKHPIVKWKTRATSDLAQVQDWWGREYPHANIGIATGERSGLTVIDLDGDKGKASFATMAAQALAAGHTPTPQPPRVQTGNGYHLYFQWSGEGSRSDPATKIDVRGTGGYVIGPPSNHHSGKAYSWELRGLPPELPPFLKAHAQASRTILESLEAEFLPSLPPPEFLQSQQHNYNIAAKVVTLLAPEYAPPTPFIVRSALAALDPNMSGDNWWKIGMALKSLNWIRSDGTDEGMLYWAEWSRGSEKFKEWEIETRYNSFNRKDVSDPVGIGTLYLLAKENGWIRPNEEALAELAPAVVTQASFSDFPPQPYTNGHASVSPGTALVPATIAAPLRPIVWRDLDEDKKPRLTCTNAQCAIRYLDISCRKDTFHEKLIVGGAVIEKWAGDLSDDSLQMLRHIVREVLGLDFGERHIRDAAIQLCLKHQYNPVTDYLDSLQWDRQPRIGTWLTRYMGAEDTAFNREVGRLTLLAAVRRAREPGCKFDQIIVLEGPEGTGKSAAIRILAGDENFSDQRLLGASDKEQQEAMSGVWLYELAELEGMRRTDVERIKQFASRTEDRARPAYGRFRVDRKRTCIFIASTNEEDYLKGTTGNRRFWPVKTRHIDTAGLKVARDQLWAEAAYLESPGHETGRTSIGLAPEFWRAAAEEQHTRLESDSWEEAVAKHLSKVTEGSCSLFEVLSGAQFLFATRDITQIAQSRVARIMVKLGWERYRQRDGHRLTWRYRPRST